MTNISEDGFQADIGYHDYVMMIAAFDAEWTRRSLNVSESHGEVRQQFKKTCDYYQRRVIENYAIYCGAEPQPAGTSQSASASPPESLSEYLFKPIFYTPFGHPDVVTLVIFDDFDPIQHVTAHLQSTVEDMSIAFCPRHSDLKLPSHAPLFVEPDSLFRSRAAIPQGAADTGNAPAPENSPELPLFAFSRFKMDAMGGLVGIVFQHALIKAMAARALEVRERLLAEFESNSDAAFMSKDDIQTLRMCFLDLQGAEELGTLIFCRNFSVAVSLIAGMKALTYADLFKVDANLRTIFDNSRPHHLVLRHGLDPEDFKNKTVSDAIEKNHVFRWTNTTMGISPEVLSDKPCLAVTGLVEASAFLQIQPGHMAIVDSEFKGGVGNLHVEIPRDYFRFQIGVADMIVPYAPGETPGKPPLVELRSVIGQIHRNLQTFSPRKESWKTGRNIVDISTSLCIPIPRLPLSRDGDLVGGHVDPDKHCGPFLRLLPELKKRLCHPFDNGDPPPADAGENYGWLDLAELEKKLRIYGVPLDLRRSIHYLFQNFAILIADPFAFDGVLDLYDVFATLHGALTQYLPRRRGEEVMEAREDNGGAASEHCFPPLDAQRTQDLSLLVDALHNALTHRVARVYPQSQFRDMAVDFRGGLDQIVLAASTPLASGLGLLRKYVFDWGGRTSHRNRVGGVTKITFAPGTGIRFLRLGIESEAWLAVVEADVSHILHAPSYADYLHECVHIVLHGLDLQGIQSYVVKNEDLQKKAFWKTIRDMPWLKALPRKSAKFLLSTVKRVINNQTFDISTKEFFIRELARVIRGDWTRLDIHSDSRKAVKTALHQAVDDPANGVETARRAEVTDRFSRVIDAPIGSLTPDTLVLRSERAEEIFVDLVTHVLLFQGDTEAFVFHHVITYAKSKPCKLGDDAEITSQYAELIIRLFMVRDAIPDDVPPSEWFVRAWKPSGNDRAVEERFMAMIDELGPLLPAYDDLWKKPPTGEDDAHSPARDYCRKQFRHIYKQLKPIMPNLWKFAMVIFEQFYNEAIKPLDGQADMRTRIVPLIQSAFRDGRPLRRLLLPRSTRIDADGSGDIDAGSLDILVLQCAMLYEYIAQHAELKGKEIYLSRNQKTGEVEYPPLPKGRERYRFQIDRGSAALFTPVPSARRLRLRQEIVMLKTFWDISASLRARRLGEIISDNWKNPSATSEEK